MGFSSYSMLSIFIGAPFILIAMVREVAIAARRIHDLNGPYIFGFHLYCIRGFLPCGLSEIGWLVIVSKILLCLIPGNKETNSYGDKPEDKIVI